MQLAVRVKTGAHRDGVWREADGLYCQIRAQPEHGDANEYLVRYLSGSLRVATSLMSISKGKTSPHKLISIDIAPEDLRPIIESLATVPQTSLFDE
jgi:uncharacterized protein YggU (UPF0235/DUF167 family)